MSASAVSVEKVTGRVNISQVAANIDGRDINKVYERVIAITPLQGGSAFEVVTWRLDRDSGISSYVITTWDSVFGSYAAPPLVLASSAGQADATCLAKFSPPWNLAQEFLIVGLNERQPGNGFYQALVEGVGPVA